MGGAFEVRKSTLSFNVATGSHPDARAIGAAAAAGRTAAAMVVLLAVALFFLIAFAGPADAKPTHKHDASVDGSDTPAGSFADPGAMDVDQGNDLLYVLDPGNDTVLKYDISDPDSPELQNFSALSSPAITEYDDDGGTAPLVLGADSDIAVDSSDGPNAGMIYVATGPSSSSATDGKVLAFDPSGEFAYELLLDDDPINSTAIDVVDSGDAAGEIYLYYAAAFTYSGPNVLHWIPQEGGSPSLDEETSFKTAGFSFGAQRLAVGDGGQTIYGPPNVTAYTPDGAAGTKIGGNAGPASYATGPNGHVYMAGSSGIFGGVQPSAVNEYSGATDDDPGVLLDTFGADATGIAIHAASNTVYTADTVAHELDVYGPGETPDVTVGDADFESLSSATLNGTVNPLGAPVTSCEFQYGTTTNYGQTATCDPSNLGSGDEPVDVTGHAIGLSEGTLYHYRIVVTNADGQNQSADQTYFAPRLPEATTGEAGPTGARSGSALLGGTVDANGTPTEWWIEYGTESDLSDAQSSPASQDLDAGDGSDPIEVTHQVKGLEPETTYYFRVVAATAAGSAEGQIRSFEMPAAPAPDPSECDNAEFRRSGTPSAALPNCRAYERVSPAETGGGSVVSAYDLARPDGDAVTYAAETGFGDQQSLGLSGAYMAKRSDSEGWVTSGIQPPAKWSQNASGIAGWLPPAIAPQFDDVYGSFTDISVPGAGTSGSTLVHRSPDGAWNTIAREATSPLALPDGQVVATGPDGVAVTDGPTPPEDVQSLYVFSRDGSASHLISLDEAGDPIVADRSAALDSSDDGSRVFFSSQTSPAPMEVWVRIDDGSTKHVTESEIGPPTGSGSNSWEGATPDGKFAYFISNYRLTADSTATPTADGRELYRYDVDSGDLVDLTTTTDPAGTGMKGALGFSDDGSVAYFEATGNLTPGASGTGSKIYRVQADPEQPNEAPEVTLVQDEIALPSPSNVTGLVGAYNYGFAPLKQAEVSADGRYVLFASNSRYDVFDPQGMREYYRFDSDTGRVDCVSCSIAGLAPAGHAALIQSDSYRGSPRTGLQFGPRPRLTPEGKVVFATPDPLVSRDTNNDYDVYIWDGEPRLISSGTAISGAWPTAMTQDGSSIFFISRGRLVGADTDNKVDLYVARVDGGLESQQYAPVEEPPCQGPACRDEEPPPPETDTPGTEQGGTPGSAPRCKAAKRKLNRAERRADRAQSKALRKQRQVRKLRHRAKRAHGKRAQRLRKRAKAARRQVRKLDRRAAKAEQRSERAARRASRCVNGGAK